MSETTTPTATPAPLYPQDALRIQASYTPARVGSVVPAGNPETVEIVLAELPEGVDPAGFVTTLIDSLFRFGATDVNHNLTAVDFCGTTRREAS